MSRPSPCSLLLALAFAAALPMAAPPAHAQANQRAYAPEDLWTLTTSEQERVISLEYREQSNGRVIPNDQMRFYLDQVRLSRWTFSKVKQDIAKSLGNTGGGGWRPPGGNEQTIRCESNDGRARTCNTPWQSQSTLRRQLSSTRCTLGSNWFTSRGQVTVTNGCRAEFGPGNSGGGGGQGMVTVQCESTEGRLRTCGSGLVGRAQLQRQLSSTRCIEGSNFGLRNGSVWVNGGCRGVFLARNQFGGGGGSSDYSVTCSSNGGRYTTCAWDVRRGTPRLVEQLSREPCRDDYSWGYTARTGLWVNHGCRARFGTR
jgi:hypothetical protein